MLEASLEQPRLRQLHAYWQEKRGDRPFPARADIDPAEMLFILGDLILFDIEAGEDGQPRFRYRLFGSNIVQRQGFDMTGKCIDQHPWPGFANRAREGYLRLVQTGLPDAIIRREEIDGRLFRHQSLLLPLGITPGTMLGTVQEDQAPRVNMILVGVAFDPDA